MARASRLCVDNQKLTGGTPVPLNKKTGLVNQGVIEKPGEFSNFST